MTGTLSWGAPPEVFQLPVGREGTPFWFGFGGVVGESPPDEPTIFRVCRSSPRERPPASAKPHCPASALESFTLSSVLYRAGERHVALRAAWSAANGFRQLLPTLVHADTCRVRAAYVPHTPLLRPAPRALLASSALGAPRYFSALKPFARELLMSALVHVRPHARRCSALAPPRAATYCSTPPP
ncbi:hypothetical protein FISHEDRAFT_79142 [Fistulina hepatica ATCC 64428]|uniref:Uncharacterized protein n=1 Tax=Fistulina hepatica ATCC 64428 TaxID=1128425 RepID=A0A0D7A064_9AGAR|nr:hypothetical protein FISHEDRAFT_79142 [Fistulina hepatica ATCC 64428]